MFSLFIFFGLDFLKNDCSNFCEEFFFGFVGIQLSSVWFSWGILGVLPDFLSVELNVVRMKQPQRLLEVLWVHFHCVCDYLRSFALKDHDCDSVAVFKVVANCFLLCCMDISKLVWGLERPPEFCFVLEISKDHL